MAVGRTAGEAEPVIGGVVDTKLFGVEIFEEEFITDPSEVSIKSVFRDGVLPEFDTMIELDAVAIWGNVISI